MKYYLLFIVSIISLNLFGQDSLTRGRSHFKLPLNSVPGKSYVPNTIIVKFKNINLQVSALTSSTSTMSILGQSLHLKSASVNKAKQLFPASRLNKIKPSSSASVEDTIGLEHIIEIKYTSTVGIEQVINELLENPNVVYAEPRHIYHTNMVSKRSYVNRMSNIIYHPYISDFNYTPNDPYEVTMQSYLEQVKAPEAWNIAIGSVSPIIIAVVDTGSQLDHPDLAANIMGGYDLVGADSNNPVPDNNPNVTSADNAHGVHVSGLASGVTNNGIGIASIVNNYAQLLIVKAAGDDGELVACSEGIIYAADHGAKIINCSWGGDADMTLQDAINYAISKDCLVVAAAGNNHDINNDPQDPNAAPYPLYPAAYLGVFTVASVNFEDQKSYFSNYGPQVSIAAPGGDADSLNGSVAVEELLNTYYPSTYEYEAGTSMAAPLVCSAAALVKAKFPSLTMAQVGAQLKATADNISSLNPTYVGALGAGRLNVYRALTQMPNPVTPTIVSTFEIKPLYPNPSADNVSLDMNLPTQGPVSVVFYSTRGDTVKVLNENLQMGWQKIVMDVSGLANGIYFCRVNYQNTGQVLTLEINR